MKLYKKAVLPIYFKAGALACGIKRSGKPDLALLYSHVPAKASCLFTANKIQAAPIKVNKSHLKHNGGYKAILINSGNANCFTGASGVADARGLANRLAFGLAVKKEEVLVASTGIIGRRLPVGKIRRAIPQLIRGLSLQAIGKVSRAILTTDTFSKEISVKFNLGKSLITICGIAKGAGMIAPDMATMLVFILTDARITQQALDKALRIASENSFNCITVDGCMSTNDTVMLFANGLAKNDLIEGGRNLDLFRQALSRVCLVLAQMIIRDAEGASKFITVKVSGARNIREAKRVALGIADSNLFKTAMFASSPNVLGRIVAAAGASGVGLDEDKLKIAFSPLAKKEVEVKVALGRGRAEAIVYTSDLTYKYVKINAEYN